MLAYVFWHRPRPAATPEAYESLLRDFHRALAAAPPPGFQGSAAFRLSGIPWAPGGGPIYEDWYLVSGLYGLREGSPALPRARRAVWLAKPAGLNYETFYRDICAAAHSGPSEP